MNVLYRGFDGLDVSFQGQISADLSAAFESAKEQAQRFRKPSPFTWNGIPMLISESGAKGGYTFVASTGTFGATWFFKKPNAHDPWGIRVSCNSFFLALNGLGKARAEIYRTLEQMGITIALGSESISRIDYAIDVLAPSFALSPENFVMHSNANRSDHLEHPEITVNGHSGRVTSVTVGKMPGRQVIVYDKRAEVIAKSKVGWWEIWNAARAASCLPPLKSEDPTESRIWRVELRAGKQHLKDRWCIRSWSDLDRHLGDMIAATLDAVRYTNPTSDTNRSRWPDSELWRVAKNETDANLFEMRMHADPNLVKQVQKEAYDQLLARQMTGLLTTRAAISGIRSEGLYAFALNVGKMMATEIQNDSARFERKLNRATERFSILP